MTSFSKPTWLPASPWTRRARTVFRGTGRRWWSGSKVTSSVLWDSRCGWCSACCERRGRSTGLGGKLADSLHPKYLHRSRPSSQRHGGKVLVVRAVLHYLAQRLAHQDLTRPRLGAEPVGHIDRIADHGVLQAPVA